MMGEAEASVRLDGDTHVLPLRIQRSRAKGSRLPPNTVCVTRPGRWGNPFEVYREMGGWVVSREGMEPLVTCSDSLEGKERASRVAVEFFRTYVKAVLRVSPDWLAPLRGKSLACWCPVGSPCHGDVLLELATAEGSPC